MTKITFIGDIMCEEPLLRASKHGGSYNFDSLFLDCKDMFDESDYVVGNLETVFAGEAAGYTKDVFSFNTPSEFAVSMANSGIDMVTTATNHALDRDKAGLYQTLDVLDQVGIEHIGAYRRAEERNSIHTKKFKGKSIAFLNYTYGTNLNESPFVIEESEYYILNLLMPQKRVISNVKKGLRGCLSNAIYRLIPLKYVLKIKRLLGRTYVNQYVDRLDTKLLRKNYLDRIEKDIKNANNHADLVVVCLHIGGQFNEMPGEQVKYFVHKISDFGADFIINTHAHVVQNYEKVGKTFVVNCLGNFSISPSSVYVPHKLKPEYSIALHLYLENEMQKISFSILKIVENKKHNIRVLPVDILARELPESSVNVLQSDITFIYNRFTGKQENCIPILKEYLIEV